MATVLDPFFFFLPASVVTVVTTTAQTGTEDTTYPLTNVASWTYANLANPSKLNEVTGAWQLDLGSASRVDYAILQINADTGLAVDFQMNASTTWTSPSVTVAKTMPARRADGYARKLGVDVRAISGYSVSGYRYIRVRVAGTNSVPLGLKVVLYSAVQQVSRDVQWGREDTEHQIGIDMRTDAGYPWAYDLTSGPRSLTGTALLDDADAETIKEWFRDCAGGVNLTAIVPDPVDNEPWIVRWSPGGFAIGAPTLNVYALPTVRTLPDLNVVRLAFEEVPIGDPEWD